MSGGTAAFAVNAEGRLTTPAQIRWRSIRASSEGLISRLRHFLQPLQILHNREISRLSILIMPEWTTLPNHPLNVVNGLGRCQFLTGNRMLQADITNIRDAKLGLAFFPAHVVDILTGLEYLEGLVFEVGGFVVDNFVDFVG